VRIGVRKPIRLAPRFEAKGNRAACTKSVMVLIAVALWAACTRSAPKPAVVRVDAARHVFGKVKRMERLHHWFVMTNLSDSPVLIEGIESSCSCMEVVCPERTIDSRGQAKVGVDLESRAPGRTSGRIRIRFDRAEAIELALEAIVDEPITVVPTWIEVCAAFPGTTIDHLARLETDVDVETPAVRVLTDKNTSAGVFHIRPIEDLVMYGDLARREWEIGCSIRAGPGVYQSLIQFQSSRDPQIASAKTMCIITVANESTRPRAIIARRNTASRWSATLQCDDIDWLGIPTDSPECFQVNQVAANVFELAGDWEDTKLALLRSLTLSTNDESRPFLEVPFLQFEIAEDAE
jgi:hypothetical protein